MAKVYIFPKERKLPAGMEMELKRVAKNYVEVLYATMTLFEVSGDVPSYEEMKEMVEKAFATGILEAIEELEES